MNEDKKRRQRRKERDLRWVTGSPKLPVPGSHRHKKIFGVPKKECKKHYAFWCNETDPEPLLTRLFFLALRLVSPQASFRQTD